MVTTTSISVMRVSMIMSTENLYSGCT